MPQFSARLWWHEPDPSGALPGFRGCQGTKLTDVPVGFSLKKHPWAPDGDIVGSP